MSVKTTWIDPNSGKEYSYNWGFDVDSTIPKNKNSADYFDWAVDSIDIGTVEENIVVTITGFTKNERVPFKVNINDMEVDINNRMNGKEEEKENMDRYSMHFSKYREAFYNIKKEYAYNIPVIAIQHDGDLSRIEDNTRLNSLEIKNVIFNPPATIVFWTDGTKTVVKCQNHEEFDHEKGLTMAFFKKMHGNSGHYFEEIKKWTEKYEGPVQKEVCEDSKWHIWYKIGMLDEIHCYEKDYSTKSGAIRRAKKLTNDHNITAWCVSQKDLRDPERFDAEWHFN